MLTDTHYMERALTIARQALGRTSPNPLVGAVIVKDGEIIGEGWHHKAGTPHAEIHALAAAGTKARGATLYVTLEPCSHYGRTGPCSEAIIQAGIKKVVVAMTDPNPLVAGRGLEKLRAAGIDVVENVLKEQAVKLNEVFIKWITTKKPFTVLKSAMTLDGKIATYTGHSKWITSSEARNMGHQLRDRYDAILVGIGTVLADNPELTTRLDKESKNPVRIVVDSKAKIPLDAKVVCDGKARTIIAVTEKAPQEKVQALLDCGVEVVSVPGSSDEVDLHELFTILGAREITSVLIEGGARINASVLAANLVDKVCWFIAPKIIGGQNAPSPVGGQGVQTVDEAIMLQDIKTQILGEDIVISAYVVKREEKNVYRTG